MTTAMRTACAYMKRLLKSALGAQVYPVGRFACQLHTPNDTLQLSVFLPLCQTKTCFLKVRVMARPMRWCSIAAPRRS